MNEPVEVTLIQAASAIVQTFAMNSEKKDEQLFDAAKKFLIAKFEK